MVPDALARLPLACPIDGLALAPGPHGLACPAGHNHDVARAGYASLLPVGAKPSRAPGDDAAMVAARRRVLEADLFAPVADALEAMVASCLHAAPGAAADVDTAPDRDPAAPTPRLVLDAGCGEGWYTERLRAALARDPAMPATGVLGIDVSKPAVTAAARRYPHVGWAVANNRVPPVLRGRADVVTSLFGFETWAPWAALQVPGQCTVTASAGPDHLVELRRLVYGTVRVHGAPRDGAATREGYACDAERRVTAVRDAGAAPGIVRDALAMTPHAHRVPAARAGIVTDGIDAIGALTIDVVLRAWRRTRSPSGHTARPDATRGREPGRLD